MAKRFADIAVSNAAAGLGIPRDTKITKSLWKATKFCAWDAPKGLVVDTMWGGFAEGLGIREPRESKAPGETATAPEMTGAGDKSAAQAVKDYNKRNKSTATQYVFTPLFDEDPSSVRHTDRRKRFRLLEILPGTRQDDVCCTMEEHWLDSAPPYEALSYCWGSVTTTTPVQVNGQTLEVTENLRTALFHLRSETASRRIWADAICIDDASLVEKETQVACMGDIYRSAVRTVVWLDVKGGDTHGGFKLIRDLLNLPPGCSEGFDFDLTDNSIEELVEAPWWSRVWVVQELVLAKEVVLVAGHDSMDWDSFCRGIEVGYNIKFWEDEVLDIIHSTTFDWYRSMKAIESYKFTDSPGSTLLDLLIQLRVRKTSEPSDKIFSILSLLGPDMSRLGITPDYEASVETVYTRAAKAMIVDSGKLNVFGVASTNLLHDLANSYPSWVPDWYPTYPIAVPLSSINIGEYNFCAAQRTKTQPRFSEEDRVIAITGHILDTLVELAETMPEVNDFALDDDNVEKYAQPPLNEAAPADAESKIGESSSGQATNDGSGEEKEETFTSLMADAFKDFGILHKVLTDIVPCLGQYVQWEKFADVDGKAATPSGLSRREVYWKTLCLGSSAATAAEFEDWMKKLSPIRSLMWWKVNRWSNGFRNLGFLQYMRKNWEAYPVFQQRTKYVPLRRLAKTRSGYLCLVLANAQIGDQVWLAEGADTPLVLRSRDDGAFTLVGEAYVHEVMDGSAFNPRKCTEILIK